jgi:metal-responsive CopG/Arc/MetJ family transcriptional regulator
MKKKAKPVPTKRITVSLAEKLAEALDARATQNKRSLSSEAALIIEAALCHVAV